MSYIRAGHPLKFVKGESKDYIWSDGKYIEDYGRIDNTTIIELLYQWWDTDDDMFKDYLLKNLAKKLNVELRDRPLTFEELCKEDEKLMEEFHKKWDKIDIEEPKPLYLPPKKHNRVDGKVNTPIDMIEECDGELFWDYGAEGYMCKKCAYYDGD